jgi:hypothetical protein
LLPEGNAAQRGKGTAEGNKIGVELSSGSEAPPPPAAAPATRVVFKTIRKTTSYKVTTTKSNGQKTTTTAKVTKPSVLKAVPPVRFDCSSNTPPPASIYVHSTGIRKHLCTNGKSVLTPTYCYEGPECVSPERPRVRIRTRTTTSTQTVTVTRTKTQTQTVTSIVTIPAPPPPDVDAMVKGVLDQLPDPIPLTSPPLTTPDQAGVVGIRFYYAVPVDQWRPIAPTAKSNGATLTLIATPYELQFDPADGTVLKPCRTSGRQLKSLDDAKRYTTSLCSHVYQSSPKLEGAYAASLSIRWKLSIETSGLDPQDINARIPETAVTRTDIAVPIVEIQPVLR